MVGLLLLALLAGQAQELEPAVDAPAAAEPTEEELKQRLAIQPAAVRDFIERRAGCNHHWTGEEPYDAERRREIEAAIADLRCQAIEADEAAVRRRFVDHPDTLQLLDETAERDGW